MDGFLEGARATYVAANAATLRWMLARRPLRDAFLNTKQNSLTLADYRPGDGLRGPDYLYGWIQGRGLESVASHAGFFAAEDPELAEALDAAGRRVYPALDELHRAHGRAYFCYDRDLQPVYADASGRVRPQEAEAGIFTYSDAFVGKGLVAAAARFAPAELPRQLASLQQVIDSIEAGRFLMAEDRPLTETALAAQHDDLGPRMILLGAAALFARLDRRDQAAFAERFIAHVLERHFDPRSGLLRNVPGADECNVGHGIEFCGFVLEYLPEDADPALLRDLERILTGSFRAGFTGPGIRLTVSLATLQPLSPYCPWWSLPETIRAAALLFERTRHDALLPVWQTASQAFFGNYWRGTPPIAYQTMTAGGPVDHVPATPDLDPGYHTGLSLLAAIEAADRLTA